MTSPSTAPEALSALAGGRYRTVGILGMGGMATVYRVLDTRLGVQRAIKMMTPALSRHEALRKRFEAEARTMARLHHPNIVTLLDVCVEGDLVYIVMELVEGGTLADWVRANGAMPPRMATGALRPVLDALAFAHEKGVVHRDIKPQNVLVTPDGVPKLTDFGIAQVNDGGQHLTTAGTAMGTLAFMPPEQRLDAHGADARADLYSVGSTLYALLTARDPFDLYAAEMRDALYRDFPDLLAPWVQRATSFRPEDRFADAREMAVALDALITRLPADPAMVVPLGYTEPANATFLPSLDEASSPNATLAPAMEPAAEEPPPAAAPAQDPSPPRRSLALPVVGALLVLVGIAGFALTREEPVAEPPAAAAGGVPPVKVEAPVPPPPPDGTQDFARTEPIGGLPPASQTAIPSADVGVVRDPAPATKTPAAAAALPAPRKARGQLLVNSIPWSEVRVDGADKGQTAWKGEVTAGRHTVVLTAEDGRTTSQTVEVDADGDTRLCWDFARSAPCAR